MQIAAISTGYNTNKAQAFRGRSFQLPTGWGTFVDEVDLPKPKGGKGLIARLAKIIGRIPKQV